MNPLYQTGLGTMRDMPDVPLSAFEWRWKPLITEPTPEELALAYQRKYFKERYIPASQRKKGEPIKRAKRCAPIPDVNEIIDAREKKRVKNREAMRRARHFSISPTPQADSDRTRAIQASSSLFRTV
ncbi:MAG: hypothetical protein WC100_02500 [Sterolibacterium sp.]